jgi:putative two-component system response regulator
MAIVDVYDALTDERPYKKAFSHEKSIDIIRQEKGEHFDPLIAEVFLAHEKEFENVKSHKTYAGMSGVFQSSRDLSSTLTAVSNMVGIKGSAHMGNMRHYLKTFLNALAGHDEYKNEVSEWDIDFFLISAHLYDVGKIAINSGILNKSGMLTEDEYEEVRGHTHFGVKIIRQIGDNVGDDSLLHHAEVLAGCHHEKWDGTGYPCGLKGEEIPLQGRIMAIVDVYDALTTDRPHRKKKTHKESVEIVRNSSETHFDPALVEVFLECEKEFDRIGKAGLEER